MNIKRTLKKVPLVESLYRTCFSILAKTSPITASRVKYYISFGKKLNLENPGSFNEKLMWLKLFEDDSKKAVCADKFMVREYVENLGLSDILIDLYSVYDKLEDIKLDELPMSFVLKYTNGSGCNIICSDKNKLDEEEVISKIKEWMNIDYSLISAEPHYSKIVPRIIVERFLCTEEGVSPIDYKIHCFHGEPQVIEVVLDRGINERKHIMFNNAWDILPYTEDSCNFISKIKRPDKIDEMLEIARRLSSEFTYVRVDLYYYEDKIYFGELTFTPAGCVDTDLLTNADYEMGKLLDLKNIQIKKDQTF